MFKQTAEGKQKCAGCKEGVGSAVEEGSTQEGTEVSRERRVLSRKAWHRVEARGMDVWQGRKLSG